MRGKSSIGDLVALDLEIEATCRRNNVESVGEKLGDSTKHEESVGYNFGDNDTKRMG